MKITKKIPPESERLQEILKILQPDGLLFWRLKPKLKVIFQNVNVSTNLRGLRGKEFSPRKSRNTFRIICLGASPTFGWGVPFEETYSQQLERMLRKGFPTKRFEVINAGVPGYTSFQGLNFLKREILKYSPDLITVSYVINDVDRHRFYRSDGTSDKELLPMSSLTIAIQDKLFKSRLYQSLIRVAVQGMKEREGFSGLRGEGKAPEVRVSLEDYRGNLEEINRIVHNHSIDALFLKMPVNLPLPPKLPESKEADLARYISRGTDYLQSGLYGKALGEFQGAVALNPYFSEAYFYLGSCYEAEKEYGKAEEAFGKAKKYDAFRCRLESMAYNQMIERIADRNRVPLVDIVSIFAAQRGQQLFVEPRFDPIHPNPLGHQIIAQEIYKTLIAQGIL